MRLLIITIILSLTTGISFSQDRINREKLHFNKKSDIILKSTGWSYNSSLGEWIDYTNVICGDKDFKDKYKVLQGPYMMSQTSQNFISIQTKTISFNSVNYYAIIVESWDGSYEYPNIKQDWYFFKETCAYIFTENEYRKLYLIDSNIVELTTDHMVRLGYGKSITNDGYNESEFIDLIQTELSDGKNALEYKFPIKSYNGMIRYYIPRYFPSYDNYDFEDKYFETDTTNFQKLIIK